MSPDLCNRHGNVKYFQIINSQPSLVYYLFNLFTGTKLKFLEVNDTIKLLYLILKIIYWGEYLLLSIMPISPVDLKNYFTGYALF